MRVELTGFSQGVSLAQKDEHTNYLDFRTDEGKEFRIPVSEEALHVLLGEIYEAPTETVEEEEARHLADGHRLHEEEEGASVFGDEDSVSEPVPLQDDEVDGTRDPPHDLRFQVPESEEEVPSL